MQRLSFGVVYDEAGRVRRLQLPPARFNTAMILETAPRLSLTAERCRAVISRMKKHHHPGHNTLGEETAIGLDAARNPIALSAMAPLLRAWNTTSSTG